MVGHWTICGCFFAVAECAEYCRTFPLTNENNLHKLLEGFIFWSLNISDCDEEANCSVGVFIKYAQCIHWLLSHIPQMVDLTSMSPMTGIVTFKGFCCKRCFEYFWKQNGKKKHGCKCEQKLPGAGEKCQRFEYSGDPERPIFSWERYRPEWLPRVEEC